MSAVTQARSRVAVEGKKQKREGGSTPSPSLENAQRLLAEEKIKAFVARTVAAAPPLMPDQRDRLALLLRGRGPEFDAEFRANGIADAMATERLRAPQEQS